MAEARVDFFISYTGVDRRWAEWIAWQLEESGWSTRLQAWDFVPGANFVLEMERAAIDGERTIVVLTPAYLEALYTQPEWAAAFAADPTGAARKLVPVKVRECAPLDGLLAQVVPLDLVGLDAAAARDALLAGLRHGRAKPQHAPAFPGDPQPAAVSAAPAPAFPGGGPTIERMPSPTRSFTGRAELLGTLNRALDGGRGDMRTRVQILHGLGGVGKTQTAARLATERRDAYDVVWWIRSEEEQTRRADYADLAGALGLVDQQESVDQDAAVAAVRAWLTRSDRWLLVFDNAPDPRSVAPLIPGGTSGDVVVTTRSATGWRAVGEPCAVDAWQREEAVAFLVERTGDSDRDAAADVAEALGDLPLALEQAGAYVDSTGIALADFRTRLREHAPALFAVGEAVDYEHTVATTWELAFREVESDVDARAIVHVCALLAPDPIPSYLIEALIADPLVRDRAMGAVRRFSLLTAGRSSVTMHRLVQRIVRERLSPEERAAAIARALDALLETFPRDVVRTDHWPRCLELLPHATVVVDAIEQPASELDPRTVLMSRLESFHYRHGEFLAAMELARKGVAIRAAVYGEDDPRIVLALSRLGVLQARMADYDASLQTLERAVRLLRQADDPDPEDLWTTLVNLGTARGQSGDAAGARDDLEEALAAFERRYGADDERLAATLINLGIQLRRLGDLRGARERHERAVALRVAADSPDPRDLSIALSNLGTDLAAEGDFEGAHELQAEAVALLVSAVGEDHVDVVHARLHLGMTLMHTPAVGAAREQLEEALRVAEASLPGTHPLVAGTMARVAECAALEGDAARAAELDARLTALGVTFAK